MQAPRSLHLLRFAPALLLACLLSACGGGDGGGGFIGLPGAGNPGGGTNPPAATEPVKRCAP
ncbi:hypothetical protein [Variovorax sp.]|jgi:hypothetical protein|uniref:hypothetical protein n=1 Tax=Variovorax TaxID=34072 RepID=UPI00137EEB6A|nr:hypothetical protein [Variovorax sp.]KAF1067476.1 MAG: hypothetical protein GAK39_04118 [Variovorax sp.]